MTILEQLDKKRELVQTLKRTETEVLNYAELCKKNGDSKEYEYAIKIQIKLQSILLK